MASSSSSPSSFLSSRGWRYEVFLSFRGEDTRYNFLDHLYAALHQKGLCVFKDDVMLRRSEEISQELLKSIEESMVAVVVFSKQYANSSWCLAELTKIMECHKQMGLMVIPVFYHVNPSDVRGQKNNFEIAFQQHENKFKEEMDKVNEWRKALTSAANLGGYHISETSEKGESTYINKVVHEIFDHIAHNRLSDMDNDLIGIERHLCALISLLGIEEAMEEVHKVGIYGMGGIGKTAIARSLFNRIFHKFEGHLFVNNVREKCSSTGRGICALQQMVLTKILKINHNFDIQVPEDGANIIRTRLSHKRVLLVLDDVDDPRQLDVLADSHMFGPGSRIVITTRDVRVLHNADKKYKMVLLQPDQALQLFSRHAFKNNTPLKGYEELSSRAIHHAGYLPLAVKVLGSFFYGMNAGVWESALNRLSKEPNEEIFHILKLSFDGLTESEKKIFLDLACFFKGKYEDHVKSVLDGFGFDPVIGIEVLVQRSLITVSRGWIDMHDLIQEMGWQIVRKSFPNSRLWKIEEITDVIMRNKKLDEIEAIVMPDNQYNIDENMGFSANIFKRMKNLRLLDINVKFTFDEPTFLPYGLRWLRWKQYPFSSLPTAKMHKLVGLEVVGGNIKQFWNGQQIMKELKHLKLEELDFLTVFPDVSRAPNIEMLELSRCKNLVEVHESLGSHKRLVKLHILKCERFKHLPTRIEMKSLKFLRLYRCSSLEVFPDISGAPNIKDLALSHCKSLVEVHESLGSHTKFSHGIEIDMVPTNLNNNGCSCKELKTLPKELRSIENLRIHRPVECFEAITRTHLKSLHTLTNLWRLDLHGIQIEDEDFPKDLHLLSSLRWMDLAGNKKLTKIPLCVSHLSGLIELKLNSCSRLQNLHGLPSSVRYLEASGCSSLDNIEALSIMGDILHKVSLFECKKVLVDQENEICLNKILESLSKRCPADYYEPKIVFIDRDDEDVGEYNKDYLFMFIAGEKIPTWFNEGALGCCKVELEIPSKNSSQIIGIVICAVFPPYSCIDRHTRMMIEYQSRINWKWPGTKRCDIWDDYVKPQFGKSVWILYIPFAVEDGVGGTLHIAPSIINHRDRKKEHRAVRCGARLVYKEDVESPMPLKVYSRRNHKRIQEDNPQDCRKLPRLES